MIAFILSGAGNRGPTQVGAVRALLEAGIKPDMIVGTSAGAINALYLAAHGVDSPATVDGMIATWQGVKAATLYPGNILQIGWRILSKEESIFPNKGMRQLLEQMLPARVQTFADLQIPLYVTTTDLTSTRLFLFGLEPSAPLVDAVLASAAVPAIHPPVLYRDLQLVDGGAVANVPASVAMDQGATELYAINAGHDGSKQPLVDGVIEVLSRTLTTLTTQSLLIDLDRATRETAVDLHHIQVRFSEPVSFRDFSKTGAMVQEGYDAARAYLAAPRPRSLAPATTASSYGEQVGAAREYIPPHLRQ